MPGMDTAYESLSFLLNALICLSKAASEPKMDVLAMADLVQGAMKKKQVNSVVVKNVLTFCQRC